MLSEKQSGCWLLRVSPPPNGKGFKLLWGLGSTSKLYGKSARLLVFVTAAQQGASVLQHGGLKYGIWIC